MSGKPHLQRQEQKKFSFLRLSSSLAIMFLDLFYCLVGFTRRGEARLMDRRERLRFAVLPEKERQCDTVPVLRLYWIK